jgi:hypothetical protein
MNHSFFFQPHGGLQDPDFSGSSYSRPGNLNVEVCLTTDLLKCFWAAWLITYRLSCV